MDKKNLENLYKLLKSINDLKDVIKRETDCAMSLILKAFDNKIVFPSFGNRWEAAVRIGNMWHAVDYLEGGESTGEIYFVSETDNEKYDICDIDEFETTSFSKEPVSYTKDNFLDYLIIRCENLILNEK